MKMLNLTYLTKTSISFVILVSPISSTSVIAQMTSEPSVEEKTTEMTPATPESMVEEKTTEMTPATPESMVEEESGM